MDERRQFALAITSENPSDPTQGLATSTTDSTVANSEKIDKLVGTIIELRTTLRIRFAIIGVGFPLMIGLLTFLVAQSFGTASKIDRLNDQISVVRGDYARLVERLDRLERPTRP